MEKNQATIQECCPYAKKIIESATISKVCVFEKKKSSQDQSEIK